MQSLGRTSIDDDASDQEILEAIEVGMEISGSPGTTSVSFARNMPGYSQ